LQHRAEDELDMDRGEAALLAAVVAHGGFENPVNASALVLDRLLSPTARAWPPGNDGVAEAIAEVHRFTPAVRRLVRWARAPIPELGMVMGDPVLLDLAVPAEDSTFTSLAFGAGPHRCPGRSLAAHMVPAAVVALVDNLPDLVVIEREAVAGPVTQGLRRLVIDPVRDPKARASAPAPVDSERPGPSTLGTLLAPGLDAATIHFACDDITVPVRSLVDTGASLISEHSPAPAIGALLTNDPTSVALVLGAIVTGTRLVSLPLPSRGGDLIRYASLVRDSCSEQGVDRVVARDDVAALLASANVPALGHSAVDGEFLAHPGRAGFELVQFSSGSTGRPKGVRLDATVLGANVSAILSVLETGPDDIAVSWLPLSHDMGLIGMLFGALAAAGTRRDSTRLVLLEPEQFLRAPARWLEAIGRWRGTFTASPDFGYRLAARPQTGPLDLSSLRCAIVGGEIVRASTLEQVEAALADAGLGATVLSPAYGLAEIGLAVAMTPINEPWVSTHLDTQALADGVWSPTTTASASTTLVASGRPLPGYRIAIDRPAPSAFGTIAIGGRSAGRDAATGRSFADDRGLVTTGDLGFEHDGWLYVGGRLDDHLVVAGRNIYAPAVEDAVSQVDGIRSGRATAIDIPDGSWIVVAEQEATTPASEQTRQRLRRAVRRAAVDVARAAPDEVGIIGRGTLPMTSSGKVQRHAVRRRWMLDRFGSG